MMMEMMLSRMALTRRTTYTRRKPPNHRSATYQREQSPQLLRQCAAQGGGRCAGSRDDQPRLQDAQTRVGLPPSKRHALARLASRGWSASRAASAPARECAIQGSARQPSLRLFFSRFGCNWL